MSRIIEVVPYDPQWPEQFEGEASLIKKALGENCVAVHHVGSTSVPGLCAKPKVDIIAVVKDLAFVIPNFENTGYKYKGEFNIPFHLGFAKRKVVPEVNLHVYEENNPEIELNLLFRNYLRDHPKMRDEYGALKLKLVSQKELHEKNNALFSGYNLGKDKLIQKILNLAGFQGLCLRICTHYSEWEAYHRIRKEQIFDRHNVIYDINHTSFAMENHHHMVLYKGTVVVAVAHIERLNEAEAALRSLATDEPHKRKGYGTCLLILLEKWIQQHGVKVLKMHANLEAEQFYRTRGYEDMIFDDPSIAKEIINLGKVLK